jgi:hypothetical protein
MKVKTNIRAGAKSGTVASGNKGGSTTEVQVEAVTPAPVPVSYTRCVGI